MSMISTATSGLTATQVVMNMIAENVANATTDGYSRQVATLSTTSSGGVTVSSITRVSSDYLNSQLWDANSEEGYYTSYEEYISSTEDVLSSDSMDINTLLDSFYSALSAASASPDDDSLRETVLSTASAVADGFNYIYDTLSSQYESISDEIDTSVSSANDLLSTIADLNDQIATLQASGSDTSSLEDARDEAVSSLSSLMEINVETEDDGTYTITLDQGQPLVSGSTASSLTLNDDGTLSVQYKSQTFTSSDDIGGSIGGLLDYQNDVLTPTLDTLNELAASFADALNSAQTSGYDIDGNSGTAMYTYDSSNAAGTIAIVDDFTTDDLAFSGDSTNGSGDNTNLLAMLDLQDDQEDAYSTLLSSVAVKSSSISSALTSSSERVDSVEESISSNSGVSSDEEAANLVAYEQAYSANAKVISVASELFDTLINMF